MRTQRWVLRAAAATLPVCLGLVSGSSCTVNDGEQRKEASEALSTTKSNGSDTPLSVQRACKGDLQPAGQLTFDSIATSAQAYLCIPENGERPTHLWVDASGAPVDVEVLRIRNEQEFVSRFSKLDSALRATIERTPAHEKVLADIWFPLEEGQQPSKEERLANPAEQARVDAAQKERYHALSLRLARDSESMRGDVERLLVGAETLEHPPPFISVRATGDALRKLGSLSYVAAIRPSVEGAKEEPMSEDFVPLTNMPSVRTGTGGNGTWDGTGIVVADALTGNPDSWAQLFPSGACTAAKCACPAAAGGSHMREVMGIIRNTTPTSTWNGIASGATVLAASYDPSVSATCTFVNALAWTAGKNTTVLNRSAGNDSNTGKYLDYLATQSPYPFVSASAGNGLPQSALASSLRNGMVVGGAISFNGPVRGNAVLYSHQALNTGGWELPHIVAPTAGIDTANVNATDPPALFSGTSASAPIVSGIAATLQQANSTLKSWPEAMFPGLMVGADEDVDGQAWPLNLNDDVDDADGAGLVNAENSLTVLRTSSKVDGGNTAQAQGHDFGSINTTSFVSGVYTEKWHASSANNQTLRVAAVMFSRPTCTTASGSPSCSSDPYPIFTLSVRDETTSAVVASGIVAQNYQYVAWKNTSGTTRNYEISLQLTSWQGLTFSTFGMAWMSSTIEAANNSIWLGTTGRSFINTTQGNEPSGAKPFVGNFDGTLGQDIFWYTPALTSWLWYGYDYRSPYETAQQTPPGTNYLPIAGDFDGNGATDILWYASGSTPDPLWFGTNPDVAANCTMGVSPWCQSRTTGTEVVFTTKTTATQNGTFVPIKGDFDGDGHDDIFWYAAGSTAEEIWWGRSDQTWDVTAESVFNTYTPVAGDFDGDGKTDIFFYAPGSASDGLWWGNSNRTFTKVSQTMGGAATPIVGDFDGDHFSDIFWYTPGSTAEDIWYGKTGRTFDKLSSPINVDSTYQPFSGDFNNDGISDIFWYYP